MHRWGLKWVATAAAVALLAGIPLASTSPARGQDAPTSQPAGKATITVTVMDQDQKPVAKARVRLFPAKADGGGKPTAIATERTDEDGKATLTGIADGDYTVNASLKASGAAHEKVTVSNGADATVNLTLKPRKNGGAAPTSQPA
jgi:protocatechuate 3,4-dioxygenase beta subunit